jgi:hypothetical protein
LPPHPVCPPDHAEQADRGQGEDDLVGRSEQDAHVGLDPEAGQLRQQRLIRPRDAIGHRTAAGIHRDDVAPYRAG